MTDPIRWQDRWWQQQPDGSWLVFDEATESWSAFSGTVVQPAPVGRGGLSTGAKWGIGIAVGAGLLFVIMVLAAIAIPVFLDQRRDAWIKQVEVALRNAALGQETYLTTNGTYTTSVADLEELGVEYSSSVDLSIARADGNTYCIEATHDELPNDIWSYDSDFGRPVRSACL